MTETNSSMPDAYDRQLATLRAARGERPAFLRKKEKPS